MQLSRLLFSRAVSSVAQLRLPFSRQLPLQQVGHVPAARAATQVSSAAIAVSLSPLPQQQVGHAPAVRQATQVSSAVTADSLSLQQLLRLALSAATSPLTAICLSSALSADQRSNKIHRFLIKSIMEAAFRGSLFAGKRFFMLRKKLYNILKDNRIRYRIRYIC